MLHAFAPGRALRSSEIETALRPALESLDVRGKRLLLVVPDATRTLPLPSIFPILRDALAPRVRELRVLVALGTHPPMGQAALWEHLGLRSDPRGVTIIQHRWDDPASLGDCGQLPRADVAVLSKGLIDEPIHVRVNREVLECDASILVGPVYPHELIGFSGGHKYLFPGVSGPEMVDYTHWLGSLIGNLAINGHRDTPPRAVIEQAARLVPGQRHALCLVMKGHELRGLYLGDVLDAWHRAVELSADLNIVRVPRAYHTVVACVPPRYEDLWTGSKCMTKLEPVVADGGKLILYGPHIRSPAVSYAGGGWHERVGYHVRDYILAHRDRYADVPLAVLADLVQLPGEGTYRDGVERTRIKVVVSTAIPAETCRRINLEYADPTTVDLAELEGREHEGFLVVRESGEILYRLAGA